MALLFLDSFDHYATADLTEKWSSQTLTAGTQTIGAFGRRSSSGLRCAAGVSGIMRLTRILAPADTTGICGFAFTTSVAPNIFGSILAGLWDGGTMQVSYILKPDLALEIRRGPNSGGTVIATTPGPICALNTPIYLEIKTVIHPSAGSVTVRVNETVVLTATALNTRNTATAQWTAFSLGIHNDTSGSAGNADFDDLYVLDGSGASPLNAFLGDCRVDARYPTAEGASSAWTPLSGTDNALMVDETAPDDDTTYNSTPTVNATDTHVTQDAPVPGATLLGVQLVLSTKKTDAGTCSLAPVVRHSGVDYPGTAFNPGTTYAYNTTPYGTNPGTSAAWTEAGFNAAEFGYKRTA